MMHAPIPSYAQRGFTLLIAVILSSVVLTLGLSLLDIAYKHVILASTAKASQAAFYNSDSALECALYNDQKLGVFDYLNPTAEPGTGIMCSSTQVTNYKLDKITQAPVYVFTFTVPCSGGGVSATTTIYKYPSGATTLYANGFNTCNAADPQRLELGLKATY
jgi:Tfp pilus assembly protein PilX